MDASVNPILPQGVDRRGANASGIHTNDRCEYWCVSARVMQLWKKKGVPVDDDRAMLKWYLALAPHSQAKLSSGFKKRLAQVRPSSAPGADGAEVIEPQNPYWSEFIKAFPNSSNPSQVEQIQNLDRHIHFADFALQKAREQNDPHLIKIFTDDLLRFSKAAKEQKALADKLGIESGELLQKPEVERVLAAWAYWAMASIDLALPSLCKRLVGQASPSGIREILEPALLRAKFLEPFQQAKRVAAGNNLPPWFVEKMVDSVDDYLESGRELLGRQESQALERPNTVGGPPSNNLTAPVPDNGPTPIP